MVVEGEIWDICYPDPQVYYNNLLEGFASAVYNFPPANEERKLQVLIKTVKDCDRELVFEIDCKVGLFLYVGDTLICRNHLTGDWKINEVFEVCDEYTYLICHNHLQHEAAIIRTGEENIMKSEILMWTLDDT
jgi:hypothetical protein